MAGGEEGVLLLPCLLQPLCLRRLQVLAVARALACSLPSTVAFS